MASPLKEFDDPEQSYRRGYAQAVDDVLEAIKNRLSASDSAVAFESWVSRRNTGMAAEEYSRLQQSGGTARSISAGRATATREAAIRIGARTVDSPKTLGAGNVSRLTAEAFLPRLIAIACNRSQIEGCEQKKTRRRSDRHLVGNLATLTVRANLNAGTDH